MSEQASNVAAEAAPVEAPAQAEVVSTESSVGEASGSAAEVAAQAAAEVAAEGGSKAEQKAAAAQAIKEFRIKVDGEEEVIKLDLNNEEELLRHLQMSKAAQKRMNETAELRKQQTKLQNDLSEFLTMLREDPAAILSDENIGVDLKQLAEDILEQERIENEKSPEQKERERLQMELERLQMERQKERQRQEAIEFERLQNETAQQLEVEITDAINQGELPKSPYVVKKMAEMMMMAMNEGIEVRAHDVIPIVRKNMEKDIRELLGMLPDEIIEQMVGKERIVKMRKKQLEALRATNQPNNKVRNTGGDVKGDEKKPEKLNAKDFFKNIGSF